MSVKTGPLIHVIPSLNLSNVEHPAVIKNVDKAEASLGGQSSIAKSFASGDPLQLQLRPEDPLRPSISSIPKQSRNIVMKITVPKRTGRKRNRGTDDPFEFHEDENPARDAIRTNPDYALRSLRDNPAEASTAPVGSVKQSHRFQALPDYQYSVETSSLAKKLKKHILPFEYKRIKDFDIDLTDKQNINRQMDLIPPPEFHTQRFPTTYAYHERTAEEYRYFQPLSKYTRRKVREHIQIAGWEDTNLPQVADSTLPPEHLLPPEDHALVENLREVFAEQPVITRRAIVNKIRKGSQEDVKLLTPYVAYEFRSGPWKDCYVRHGVDPRSDPKYRMYQSINFRLGSKAAREEPQKQASRHGPKWGRPLGRNAAMSRYTGGPISHIFDGRSLEVDGSTWQLCDVTDPIILKILEAKPRDICEPKMDGWYPSLTIAKIRTIMRDKVGQILRGIRPNDADYERLVTLPETVNLKDLDPTANDCLNLPNPTQREKELTQSLRVQVKEGDNRLVKSVNLNRRRESDATAGSNVTETEEDEDENIEVVIPPGQEDDIAEEDGDLEVPVDGEEGDEDGNEDDDEDSQQASWYGSDEGAEEVDIDGNSEMSDAEEDEEEDE